MVKKKVRKKRKKPVKRKIKKRSKRAKRPVAQKRMVRSSKRKIKLATKNLVLFVIISIVSYIIYGATTGVLIKNFFWLLALISGLVAVAFLIVLLVFLLLRAAKK